MPTTGDFVTAARAKTLVQLICGEPDAGADPNFERTARVAHAVGTDRQRAIVWLRQILEWEGGSRRALRTLGFDRSVVDAANTLVRRQRESVGKYAQRVAACNDSDVLAVAVAASDDEIREKIEHQRDILAAHKEARRVLKRAVDAQPPGDPSPAGGVADDRPPADLSDELLALVDHTHGAQDAMRHMLRDPGNALRGSLPRLSPDDRDLLVANLHDLLQIVAVWVFDVTARDNENTHEDRMTLAKAGTKEVNPIQGLETMALTIAHRLREFNEAQRGDEPESGKVH